MGMTTGRRTPKIVRTEFSHAQVVHPHMPIYGPSEDVRTTDVYGLHRVACFFERLNGLSVLRPVPRRLVARNCSRRCGYAP